MVQDKIYSYFYRFPHLHVLFIFDKMNIIESELEGATWDEGYKYVVFNGAWFNVKYSIENTWKDLKVILLFGKDTYPHTEEQQLQFPLLDMLKANMEYKEDDYASFMQQYRLPEKFTSFVKRHVGELMSSKVQSILNGYITPESFNEDVAIRGFITSYLGEKKLLDWDGIIVRMIILGLKSEEKKRYDFYVRLERNLDARKKVDEKLKSIFRYTYMPNTEEKVKDVVMSLKYNSITQLLDAIPADNYAQNYKVRNSMLLEQMNKVYETGTHDRALSEKFMQALTILGADIKEDEIIRWYGIDAQYFYMSEVLCWPILKEVIEQKLLADPAEVDNRMRELSLKFPDNSDIQIVVRFIERMALYYDKVRGIGTLKLNSPDEYVKRYTTEFYLLDLFYRHTLEAYHELLTKQIPIERTINEAKLRLDQDYASFANILNLEWIACVGEQSDLFGAVNLPKQVDFFSVENDSSVKQVVIISDALRYEVAAELMQELSKEKHLAVLGSAIASLPTETKYCKPSLFPHHSLVLQGTDMLVDGQVLGTTESRSAHLSRYRDGALCVNYEDIMNGPALATREIFKRPMVYILHDTIDNASHSQSTFEVIRSCRNAINELTALIRRLHATWNVTNVILTADHGFLYNDKRFEDKDKHSIEEAALEKKTRYYLTSDAAAIDGITKFPIEKVSGIASSQHVYVAVPTGTNRMAASGGYNFAHGGATLQEMVIPVIHSVRRKVVKTEKVNVALMSHNLNMVSSRLKFQIIQSEAVSMTVMERKIVCTIYSGDEPVTVPKEVILNSVDSENLNNRVYDITLTLNKSVSSGMLQLRIYDADDMLNPLIKETVKNNTIVEQDF